ncbi:MAG: MATE family efflux transporter [Thermomicrobiales bacterium]
MSATFDAPVADKERTPHSSTETEPSESTVPAAMNQRRVLGMAVPIIGENLLQTAVGAVDTLMVARLGKEAVAGVGTSIEVVFFIISALSAVSVGATVLISQAFGAGNVGRASQIARQALVWGILLAIPVSITGFLAAGTVISVFGTEPDVAANATTYLEVTAATSVVLLLTFVCGAIFRGVGDSRTPLKASIVANVVNVGVAYMLIFGHLGMPELGVAGSAWAAAAGRGVAALILIGILLRGRRVISLRGREGWQPRVQFGRQLLQLGFPAAIEQMLMSAGFMVMMAVVALLGTVALAAQQIGFTALSIAFMPGFGFAMAATALVGQSVGARNIASARTAARIAMVWGIAWMAIGGLIYVVFARLVMQAFTSDEEVIADGVRALRALAVGLPFWAIWSVNGGALRGSGDTRTPMIMSVTTVWLAVALAFGAVRWLDAGLGTVWLTFLVTSPIGALGNWLTLRRRLASGSSVLSTVAKEPVAVAAH